MSRYAWFAVVLAFSLFLLNCPTTPKPPVETVAAPAFSPAEGVFTAAQSVKLASSTAGAEIRYTTDSSVPTPTSGTVYANPVAVSATTTIRAIAYKNGMNDSPVSSATFTITGTVADIQFAPAPGKFDADASVTLSTATDGAAIYFTTDGSEPTAKAGTLYAGPITISETATLKAVGVKQNWAGSPVASGTYEIERPVVVTVPVEPVITPIADSEVTEARNAIARAREADADYYDADNYDAARRLLDEALEARSADPATSREKLAGSKEKADLAFANSVERAAQDLSARMEAMRKKLLDMEADKYLSADFSRATAGIGESDQLYRSGDYSGARTRAYKALKDMADLRDRLQARVDWVKILKRDTEQYMKDGEAAEAWKYAPELREKVNTLYVKGLNAFRGYLLDDAEENFGAAREAAKDLVRAATSTRQSTQAEAKKKADALTTQVLKELVEASKLTVVTEDGTVITPENWTEEDLLKEIEQLEQQEQQNAAPGGTSLLLPSGGETVVLADEPQENLLAQAKELLKLSAKEKAAGNYEKAQDYLNEALRYIQVYKSYAVKGVYTVRLIPERRDCLWRIAEYNDVYGDPYLWPNIWRRNRKLIQNPDLIYPGWQLVIPPQ